MTALTPKRILTACFALLLLALPLLLSAIGIEERELRSQLAFLTGLMIWGIFVLSYDLLFGYTGLLSLGHSAFLGAGAYGVSIAVFHLGFGLWSALLAGIIVAIFLSMLWGWLLVRIKGYSFTIATAVLAVIASLLVIYWSEWTGGTQGLRLPRSALELGILELSFLNSFVKYYFLSLILLGVLAALFWLIRTPLGKAFTLVRENEERAKLLGYPTTQIKWIAFSISGTLAGLAGSLLTLSQRSIDSGPLQWTISIEALAWTIVGGAGSLVGPLLGMGLLKELEAITRDIWPQGYLLASGLLLILFARFIPAGIAGFIKNLSSKRSIE